MFDTEQAISRQEHTFGAIKDYTRLMRGDTLQNVPLNRLFNALGIKPGIEAHRLAPEIAEVRVDLRVLENDRKAQKLTLALPGFDKIDNAAASLYLEGYLSPFDPEATSNERGLMVTYDQLRFGTAQQVEALAHDATFALVRMIVNLLGTRK